MSIELSIWTAYLFVNVNLWVAITAIVAAVVAAIGRAMVQS